MNKMIGGLLVSLFLIGGCSEVPKTEVGLVIPEAVKKEVKPRYILSVDVSQWLQEGESSLWYRSVSDVGGKFEKFAVTEVKNGMAAFEGELEYTRNAALYVSGEEGYDYFRLILEEGDLQVVHTKAPLPEEGHSRKQFTVSGGKYNDALLGRFNDLEEYQALLDQYYQMRYDLPEELSAEERKERIRQAWTIKKEARTIKNAWLANIAKTDSDPLMRYLAAELGSVGDDVIERQALIEEIEADLGPHDGLIAYKNSLALTKRKYEAREHMQLGNVIPMFEAPTLDGKVTEVQGLLKTNKYILVEFWASWCSPCRAEIPHLKTAYQQYHDKGFDIVSFSLDDDKEAWEEAMDEEQMPWLQLSDLMGFSSPVSTLYGVGGIPAGFLVDSEGRLLADRPRGKELTDKLQELLGEPLI